MYIAKESNIRYDWFEIIKIGLLSGLKPNEIWDLELWEYNACILAYQEKQRQDTANAIITGYYCAYYINGGKRAHSPNSIIQRLFKQNCKQSFEDGLKSIAKIMALESMQ
ncbi:MAG: hypothetical protein LBU60_06225 [Clostridiales bacterium]|nr:hypothetical protein [Clostridiales bacterium]